MSRDSSTDALNLADAAQAAELQLLRRRRKFWLLPLFTFAILAYSVGTGEARNPWGGVVLLALSLLYGPGAAAVVFSARPWAARDGDVLILGMRGWRAGAVSLVLAIGALPLALRAMKGVLAVCLPLVAMVLAMVLWGAWVRVHLSRAGYRRETRCGPGPLRAWSSVVDARVEGGGVRVRDAGGRWTTFAAGMGLIRSGGQVDYAACRSRAALSNSAGLM